MTTEERLNDANLRAQRALEKRFLQETIFRGLTVRHPAFDAPGVEHFDAADFRVVVERCRLHGVVINGVEVFTRTGRVLCISFQDDGPDSWCLDLIDEYRSKRHLSFSATYSLPELPGERLLTAACPGCLS